MSGIAAGITKTFQVVGSAAARVGSAVAGVGSSLFTAGASSAGIAGAAGSGGVLGNILTGAIKQAGIGALLGGTISAATGGSFGKGAMWGGIAGAATGGLGGLMTASGAPQVVAAQTPTGVAPTGSSAVPAATASTSNGLMSFLKSEGGGALAGNLIAGVGQGLSAYSQQKAIEDQQKNLQKSYSVDPSAYVEGGRSMQANRPDMPTADQAYTRTRNQYDPAKGRIVKVPV
ncbi:MAG: hypothetical protein M9944_13035 [Rhizobiaceae bacterium]|nr:hypothetical protein [Rhizobiaceae bacterium]